MTSLLTIPGLGADPRTKPPLGAVLDRSKPLYPGLSSLWLLNEGTGRPYDLVRKGEGGFSGSAGWVSTPEGWGGHVSTIENALSYGPMAWVDGASPPVSWSIRFMPVVLSGTVEQPVWCKWGTTTGAQVWYIAIMTTGAIVAAIRAATANYVQVHTSATGLFTAGRIYELTVVWPASTVLSIFLNGAALALVNDVNDPFTVLNSSPSNNVYSGRDDDEASKTCNINILRAATWSGRALGTADALRLYQNPYALAMPRTALWIRKSTVAGGQFTQTGTDKPFLLERQQRITEILRG